MLHEVVVFPGFAILLPICAWQLLKHLYVRGTFARAWHLSKKRVDYSQ